MGGAHPTHSLFILWLPVLGDSCAAGSAVPAAPHHLAERLRQTHLRRGGAADFADQRASGDAEFALLGQILRMMRVNMVFFALAVIAQLGMVLQSLSAVGRYPAGHDATLRSLQMSDQRSTSSVFSIWWPQTKQGEGLWWLILFAATVVGGVGGWNSAGRYDSQESAAFVGAITGAGGWYLILVVVRYVAHWFTQQRRTAQQDAGPPPATPQATVPNRSERRVAGKLCPECDTTNPDRVVWMDEKQMWCQDCGATWVPPRIKGGAGETK